MDDPMLLQAMDFVNLDVSKTFGMVSNNILMGKLRWWADSELDWGLAEW